MKKPIYISLHKNNLKTKIMLKNLLNSIKNWFVQLWSSLDKEAKALVPVAIDIVNGLKNVNESTQGDFLEFIIDTVLTNPIIGNAIHVTRARLKEILPKVIMILNISESIANIKDPNEQIKAILVQINMSADITKNTYYHDFCFLLVNAASDGKITFSESIQISEYFLKNIYPTLKK